MIVENNVFEASKPQIHHIVKVPYLKRKKKRRYIISISPKKKQLAEEIEMCDKSIVNFSKD